MISKDFKNELNKFISKIRNHESFALVRFHDGENYILNKKYIDITKKCNGEFLYDPADESFEFYRTQLINSLQYKNSTYYVGIMPGCCVKDGYSGHTLMKDFSEQDELNMTFATVFFNSNYEIVKKEFIPLLLKNDVVLICNENADVSNLPFIPKKVFFVGTNAWINNYNIFDLIKHHILSENVKNTIFLFCSGPLSNILIYRLSMDNKCNYMNNTYINFGSALDEYMFKSPTRWYQINKNGHGNHTCFWTEYLEI